MQWLDTLLSMIAIDSGCYITLYIWMNLTEIVCCLATHLKLQVLNYVHFTIAGR